MIEARNLNKSFTSGKGKSAKRVTAVHDVSLIARDGAITGLLGPNGAGKTTSLRIIATLVTPDQGQALVDGHDTILDAMAARKVLGVLSEARGLYNRLTARENIRYFGRLRDMTDDAIDAGIGRLAELIDMNELLDRRTEGFSQGERMKVAIARALIHDPQNLVLDEPTNGLDIMATRALRELIRRLRDAGKCILMSSHIMQEVSALCDHIVVVSHGRAVNQGTPSELIERTGAANLEDAFVLLTSGEHLAPTPALAGPMADSTDTP
jgi:sodium transport system ATP-binding protein